MCCVFSSFFRSSSRFNRQAQSRLSTCLVTSSATAPSVRYGHHTPKPQRCYNCRPVCHSFHWCLFNFIGHGGACPSEILCRNLTMARPTCRWSCKLASRQVDMFLCSKQYGCDTIRDASCVPAEDLGANQGSVSMPTAPSACLQPTRSSKFTAEASS